METSKSEKVDRLIKLALAHNFKIGIDRFISEGIDKSRYSDIWCDFTKDELEKRYGNS